MYTSSRIPVTQRRRAVILLVVLAMLTLFAIVGLTFVLMSDVRSTEARIFREAQTVPITSAPTVAGPRGGSGNADSQLAYFLNRLIYDDADDQYGVYDAIRGWSLARGMYGLQVAGANNVPYNGVGRLHMPSSGFVDPLNGNNPINVDLFNLVNYQYFPTSNDGLQIRDPEHINSRANTNSPPSITDYVGQNVGYTYPDQNNMFLGTMKSDGTISMRSFFRDYLFASPGYGTPGAATGALDPGNPNWTNTIGKYLILRPRPIDMGPGFPYPADLGGDVKNVDGPGYYDPFSKKYYNNDSVWMNLNYPILTNSSGVQYQPLFASYVMDLDGLLNVNSHGNIRNQMTVLAHASNHGFAASEVNLGQVLTSVSNPSEWTALLTGQPTIAGRYGSWNGGPVPNPIGPAPSNVAGGSDIPHFYAQVDVDGGLNPMAGTPIVTGPPAAVNLPGGQNFTAYLGAQTPAISPFFGFPAFPALTYLSGNTQERTNHPVLFNYFGPNAPNSTFPASEMEAILRYGQSGVPASRILQLLPNTLVSDPLDANSIANTAMRRHKLTTHGLDVDRPGLTPWIISKNNASNGDYSLVYNAGTYPNGFFPQGTPVNFPSLTQLQSGGGMEFGTTDNRARDAWWGKVDINRSMPSYPTPNANGAIPVASYPAYQAAVQARQQLAQDIFNRLRSVATGATSSDPLPAQGSQEYEAVRWLAQLAVNMVDFVNNDDYSTPFNWDPTNTTSAPNTDDAFKDGGWVFGTKLPRLLVNEAYSEYVNIPTQTGSMPVNQYNVNLWVELHNPVQQDTTYPDGQKGAVKLQATDPNSNQPYAIYKLQVTPKNANLWAPTNIRGSRDGAAGASPPPLMEVNSFAPVTAGGSTTGAVNPACTDSTLVQPANGAYSGANGSNAGFYLLGPTSPTSKSAALGFPTATSVTDARPVPLTTFATPQMTYSFTVASGNNPSSQPLSLLLRRLACPGLPPNEDPTNTATPYNPYITVDYVENLNVNDGSTNYGTNSPNTAPNLRFSMGKMQPYAAAAILPQKTLQTPYADRPQHTLFRQNSLWDTYPTTAPFPPQLPAPNADTLTFPFNWLSQLNRTVVSPIELTQVSAFKPHLLTQQFVTYQGYNALTLTAPTAALPYQHTANWFDPNLRLYRFLEMVEDHDRMGGSVRGGRYSGKVNINTLRDVETFRALCDAQPSNYFYVAGSSLSGAVAAGSNTLTVPLFTDANKQMTWDVLPGDPISLNLASQTDYEIVYVQTATVAGPNLTITTASPLQFAHANGEPVNLDMVGRYFNRLIGSRDNFLTAGIPQSGPGNPFQSFAAGNIPVGDAQYTNGNGIQNTIVAPFPSGGAATSPRLLELTAAAGTPAPHPYYKYELMNKLFDRLTTRSNVFAVWVTVGYFQVTNATTSPPQLGAEMTDSLGMVTRHKMFAIIDRSALTYTPASPTSAGPAPMFFEGQNQKLAQSPSPANAVPTTLAVDFLSGTYEGVPWSFQVNQQLLLDTGANQEVVTITSMTPAQTVPSYQPPTITISGASKPHSIYIPLSFADRALGNPGPQPLTFDPRTVGGVVKYFRLVN
jgi:hypothetical protein